MRKLLMALAILISANFALAQESAEPAAGTTSGQVSSEVGFWRSRNVQRFIGVGGVAVSDFQGREAGRFSSQNGIIAGLMLDFGRFNGVIEGGMLYRQVGATANSNTGATIIDLQYLSVPVSAKYYWNALAPTTVYFKAGLVPSILVSQDVSYPLIKGSDSPDVNPRTFELGGILGVGGKFNITQSMDVFVEADYVRGITAVAANDLYNSAFSISAGLGLNL